MIFSNHFLIFYICLYWKDVINTMDCEESMLYQKFIYAVWSVLGGYTSKLHYELSIISVQPSIKIFK